MSTPLKREDFKLLVQQVYEECIATLNLKGAAYDGGHDVLGNFRSVATETGVSPFQVWLVFANKHYRSISQAIRTNPWEPVEKSEGMQGRITDLINYLFLLRALYDHNDFRSVITNSAPSGYPNPVDERERLMHAVRMANQKDLAPTKDIFKPLEVENQK